MSQPTYGNGVFAPVAGAPDPRGPANSDFTREQFADAVLQHGGWPVTQSNVQFLLNWMQREGGSAAFNPINTTHSAAGATDYNSIGVKNYTSFDQGVDAIVSTINEGYYRNIQAGLAAGQASEWDQAGRFATDLHAWSAGPSAPMSKGYTTVSNVNGSGSAVVSGDAVAAANQASGGGGMSLTDVVRTYAPELAQAMGDPEIQDLLQRLDAGLNGGSNGISFQQFETQLEQTDWWKNTPASQRNLIADNATDPATALQDLQQQMSVVNRDAWQMGVQLQPGDVYNIALDSIKNGYQHDDAQLQQTIAAKFNYTGQALQGAAGTDLQSLRQMYADYALPSSAQDLNSKLGLILSGKQTAQDVQSQLQQQAATFYAANPQLADFLKSGQGSVRSWASPLISHAANILGLDPNTVDLTSPQWSFLLKPQTNAQTGQSTGMAQTLDSVEQTIKTDPVYGYSRTPNGVQDYTNMILKLQQNFTGGGAS